MVRSTGVKKRCLSGITESERNDPSNCKQSKVMAETSKSKQLRSKAMKLAEEKQPVERKERKRSKGVVETIESEHDSNAEVATQKQKGRSTLKKAKKIEKKIANETVEFSEDNEVMQMAVGEDDFISEDEKEDGEIVLRDEIDDDFSERETADESEEEDSGSETPEEDNDEECSSRNNNAKI